MVEEAMSAEGRLPMHRLCQWCGMQTAAILRCQACKQASYCSRSCQINDWEQHRQDCSQSAGGKAWVASAHSAQRQRILDGPMKNTTWLDIARVAGVQDLQERDWLHRGEMDQPMHWRTLFRNPPPASASAAALPERRCPSCQCGQLHCSGKAFESVYESVICWSCHRCFDLNCIVGDASQLIRGEQQYLIEHFADCPRCGAKLGACSLPSDIVGVLSMDLYKPAHFADHLKTIVRFGLRARVLEMEYAMWWGDYHRQRSKAKGDIHEISAINSYQRAIVCANMIRNISQDAGEQEAPGASMYIGSTINGWLYSHARRAELEGDHELAACIKKYMKSDVHVYSPLRTRDEITVKTCPRARWPSDRCDAILNDTFLTDADIGEALEWFAIAQGGAKTSKDVSEIDDDPRLSQSIKYKEYLNSDHETCGVRRRLFPDAQESLGLFHFMDFRWCFHTPDAAKTFYKTVMLEKMTEEKEFAEDGKTRRPVRLVKAKQDFFSPRWGALNFFQGAVRDEDIEAGIYRSGDRLPNVPIGIECLTINMMFRVGRLCGKVYLLTFLPSADRPDGPGGKFIDPGLDTPLGQQIFEQHVVIGQLAAKKCMAALLEHSVPFPKYAPATNHLPDSKSEATSDTVSEAKPQQDTNMVVGDGWAALVVPRNEGPAASEPGYLPKITREDVEKMSPEERMNEKHKRALETVKTEYVGYVARELGDVVFEPGSGKHQAFLGGVYELVDEGNSLVLYRPKYKLVGSSPPLYLYYNPNAEWSIGYDTKKAAGAWKVKSDSLTPDKVKPKEIWEEWPRMSSGEKRWKQVPDAKVVKRIGPPRADAAARVGGSNCARLLITCQAIGAVVGMSAQLQHVTTGLEAVEVLVPGITSWDSEDDSDIYPNRPPRAKDTPVGDHPRLCTRNMM